jgi:hypothetical protein
VSTPKIMIWEVVKFLVGSFHFKLFTRLK